jgi:hypothetical protein
MTEPGLFDGLYRHDDPPTSRDAAATVDVNARERECLDALRWLCRAGDTGDLQRVLSEHGLVRDRSCIARRLTSLARKGLVARTGTKQGPAGRQCTTWVLVR